MVEENKSGKLKVVEVELSFPGDLKGEPVFYDIIKNFDVIPNILEASFSTDTGWAIVKLKGKDQELEKLFDYLRSRNVSLNFK